MHEYISILIEAMASIMGGMAVFFIQQMYQDNREYRHTREQAEKAAKAKKDAEDETLIRGIGAMMESMLIDNYDKVKETGVYTLNRRTIYHNLYKQYKALGFDGRMELIRQNILTYPDEDGHIHSSEDEDSLHCVIESKK